MPYLASDIPLHPTRICIEYTAPHSGQDFSVPFPFLQREHVYIQNKETQEIYSYYLDRNSGNEYIADQTDSTNIVNKFEWISDGSIMLKDGVTIDGDFIIFRFTPRDALYHVFQNNTSIRAELFNEALTALLYAIQEGEEVAAIIDELVNLGHLTQEVRDLLLPEAPNEGDRDGKILEYVGNNREWVHAQSSATKFDPTKENLYQGTSQIIQGSPTVTVTPNPSNDTITLTASDAFSPSQANLYPAIKTMVQGRGNIIVRALDSPANEILIEEGNNHYIPTRQEIFSRVEDIIEAGSGIRIDPDNSDHTLTIVNTGGSSEGGSTDLSGVNAKIKALEDEYNQRTFVLSNYAYNVSDGITKGQFTVHDNGDIAIALKDGDSLETDFRQPGTFINFRTFTWQIMRLISDDGVTVTFGVRDLADNSAIENINLQIDTLGFARGIEGRTLTLENRVDFVDGNHFIPNKKNFYDGISPIIQGSDSVTVTPDPNANTLTLTSSASGSSDLEGVINPQTISVTAPTSSFTVEPGATRALEVTGTSGVGYVRKTTSASTVTLSKQATYRAFATVTVTNNEGSSNGRVTPELIPTGANVTVLEKVAPYIRTENNNTYTVTTSTTFTTSADNSVVGFSIGNQVCLDDRRLLLTAIPNIRILPLIGAVGEKGDKGDDGATFDETKNVRGQVSFFYSDGTHDPISRFHPDQLQRLFGATSGVGITPSDKRTDVRFLISGFIPNFTSLTELVSVQVNGLSARTRTNNVNAPLEKGEYIGNNLYYDGSLVKGTFALIATLTNQELDNLISNAAEVSFDVRYRAGSVDDIFSLRVPFLSNSEAPDIVPFIPIESVKRGIDIDQVKQTYGTATVVGNNHEIESRLQLNSDNTKAAVGKIIIPLAEATVADGAITTDKLANNAVSTTKLTSTLRNRLLPSTRGTAGQVLQVNSAANGIEWATFSSGGGISTVTTLPGTASNGTTYFQTDNNTVAGVRAPGLYVRHNGAWVVVSKTKVRIGTFSKTAVLTTYESTGITLPLMDDEDCVIFNFTLRSNYNTPVDICVPWYRLNALPKRSVGDSGDGNRDFIWNPLDDQSPQIYIALTSARLVLLSGKTPGTANSNLRVYRQ